MPKFVWYRTELERSRLSDLKSFPYKAHVYHSRKWMIETTATGGETMRSTGVSKTGLRKFKIGQPIDNRGRGTRTEILFDLNQIPHSRFGLVFSRYSSRAMEINMRLENGQSIRSVIDDFNVSDLDWPSWKICGENLRFVERLDVFLVGN